MRARKSNIKCEDVSQERRIKSKLETRSIDGCNLFVVPLKDELFGFGKVEYRPIYKDIEDRVRPRTKSRLT